MHVARVGELGREDEYIGSATSPLTLRATLKALCEQSGKLYQMIPIVSCKCRALGIFSVLRDGK